MTTDVTVKAHCSDQIKVIINLNEGTKVLEEYVLKDGDECSLSIYDNRNVIVGEFPINE